MRKLLIGCRKRGQRFFEQALRFLLVAAEVGAEAEPAQRESCTTVVADVAELFHRFLAVAGLARQGNIGFIRQNGRDAFSNQRMIVRA